jgi:hypothetical protein
LIQPWWDVFLVIYPFHLGYPISYCTLFITLSYKIFSISIKLLVMCPLSFFFSFFWWDWGLNIGFSTFSRPSTPWAATPVHFGLVILEMGSHKLFAQAGLESPSSWFQLPK